MGVYAFIIFMIALLSVLNIKLSSYQLSNKSRLLIGGTSIGILAMYVTKFSINYFNLFLLIILVYVLVYICIVDFFHKEISNATIIICLITSIILKINMSGLSFNRETIMLLVNNSIIYILFFVILMLLTGGALGMGDVKLSFPIGILLTKVLFLEYIAYAFVIGGIYGLILLILKKKQQKEMIAFGPFMIIAFFIMLL